MIEKENKKDYSKLVKILQIASGVLMLAMIVLTVVLMKKYNISIGNAKHISEMLPGSALVVAGVIIGFSVIKSFALIFPPAVIFAVSGIVFSDCIWKAYLVNIIAVALSLVLPYYLGKFTGSGMVNTLKKRFPKIQQIDNFAEENDFALVFVLKASGFLPCDVSSLIFGAMEIPFGKYFLASNIGMIPLNALWTLLGAKGDLSNPLSFLYVLPIGIFAVVVAIFMKKWSSKKEKTKSE